MKLTTKHSIRSSFFRLVPMKSLMVFAMFAVVAFAGATALAWGPERPTFTGENPADYVTFNSITNNPKHGDERNFVLIREAGVGTYVDDIQLVPGKEYEVYAYYHNNAKSTLNTSGVGIAKNVRMSAKVPSELKPGEKGSISATISADNANPTKVWDEAYVTTTSAVALRYVANSAKIYNNGTTNGTTLSSTLFDATGTYLGYNELNGIVPGCNEYSGYVIYKIKVDQPAFEVSKDVSLSGKNTYADSVVTTPGTKVDYRINYKNTGTTDQNNVTIKDSLPAGVTYVQGSTKLTNVSNSNGLAIGDTVTTSGINIGNYGPGASATVVFSAIIAAKESLNCGTNTMINTASAITGNGTKDDTATVTTTVECKPNECKPGVPTGDVRCNPCTIPGKENLAKDDPACTESCVPKSGETKTNNGQCIPIQLPKTGPAGAILSIFGVAGIALGVAYWIRSSRAYRRTLAGHHDSSEPEVKLLTARTDTKPEDDKFTL